MGINRSSILYPVNSTQVDGGFIRLLDSAQAAATDTTQTVTATHTQDAQKRTFSPATLGVTANQGVGGYRGLGYALRLSQDMTPTDDTNCNAALQSATFTLNISVAINQAGGTYTTGTYGPQWEMRLYTYDPVANTGTAINLTSVNSATTWNIAPVGGDLGTFKTVAISCTFANSSLIEFVQGNILLLQIGLDTLTIPNPTVGTATWTYTLAVDDPNTNITWAADQSVVVLCRVSEAATLGGVAAKGSTKVSVLRKATLVGVASRKLYVRLTKVATLIGAASRKLYIRTGAKLVTMAGVASRRVYVRLIPKIAALVGIASRTLYVRLVAKTAAFVGAASFTRQIVAARAFVATLLGAAGFARVIVAVRAFQVTLMGVAALYVKIKQNILNRFEGGGTTIIRRKKVIIYDKA